MEDEEPDGGEDVYLFHGLVFRLNNSLCSELDANPDQNRSSVLSAVDLNRYIF